MNNHFDIIASRTLDIVNGDGQPAGQATVHIGRPRQEPTGEWSLPYQIVGLGDDRIYRVLGFDAIQALQCAQLVIGSVLASSDEGEQGRLRWEGEPDFGFPVSPPRTVTRR
jgi:hypothetical protein